MATPRRESTPENLQSRIESATRRGLLIDRALSGEDPEAVRADVTALARQFGMP